MKTITFSRKPAVMIDSGAASNVPDTPGEDQKSKLAFYFLMSVLALNLLYFLLAPFFL